MLFHKAHRKQGTSVVCGAGSSASLEKPLWADVVDSHVTNITVTSGRTDSCTVKIDELDEKPLTG